MSESKPTARRQCSTCASELGFTEGDPCDNCVTAKPTVLLPEREWPERVWIPRAALDAGGGAIITKQVSSLPADIEYHRAHSPAQAEWLPIESAPFTGEPVLIAHGNSVWEDEWDAIEGCWQQCGRGGSHQGEVPSHWQHLPQPPKEQQ